MSCPHALTVETVNAMGDIEFAGAFGDIAEHSTWVAEHALGIRPFLDRAAMITAFCDAITQAREDAQRDLIRAHPDLAGRAALAGDVTSDSAREQAGAGLDRLTPDEFSRFTDLNGRYKERFGIPFIFAVRGATKTMILDAFERRIGNEPETEFATALDQVKRIVRFRIEDRVSPRSDRDAEPLE